MLVTSGPMTRTAISMEQARAGIILANRFMMKASGLGLLVQLLVTKKPLMMVNIGTADPNTSLTIQWSLPSSLVSS